MSQPADAIDDTGAAPSDPEPKSLPARTRVRSPSKKWRALRLRRWLARLLCVAPPLAVIALDLGRRHAHIFSFAGADLAFYFVSAALGVIVWTCLFAVGARAKGVAKPIVRVLLAIITLLAVGGQLYTFSRYGAYVNARAVLVGTSFLPSIKQQLWFDKWTFARVLLPCLAIAIAVPIACARIAPMRKRSRGWLLLDIAVVTTLVTIFVSPDRGAEQGQPPDTMYLSAMGQLVYAKWSHADAVERVHPGPRSPEPIPPLVARPSRPRNVVMIINESVRAQSVCVAYSPDCKHTPFSNTLVKHRVGLTQMRALDSTTAVSLAVMWNGLAPTAKRKDLHTAPILWDYAHAAGYESAYYTSQHMLFGNSGTWLEGAPWQRHVGATMIEQDATYEMGADDGKLIDYTLGDLGNLKEPYVVVIHLSNTHFPYKIEDGSTPFEDEAEKKKGEAEVVDRYHDSIYLQDKHVARFLEKYLARPEASRSVVMYVSDHGEQLREKGMVGHTGTLYETEVRIPFWIAGAPGTLTDDEKKSLEGLTKTPLTQLDVFPTLLDLMGIWDAPEMARFKERMPGNSLLRGGSTPDRPIIMSNCTELWACAFKNWGAIHGTRKLIAHQGDHVWNCYDVAQDPEENEKLPLDKCSDLVPLVETKMGGRPF